MDAGVLGTQGKVVSFNLGQCHYGGASTHPQRFLIMEGQLLAMNTPVLTPFWTPHSKRLTLWNGFMEQKKHNTTKNPKKLINNAKLSNERLASQ